MLSSSIRTILCSFPLIPMDYQLTICPDQKKYLLCPKVAVSFFLSFFLSIYLCFFHISFFLFIYLSFSHLQNSCTKSIAQFTHFSLLSLSLSLTHTHTHTHIFLHILFVSLWFLPSFLFHVLFLVSSTFLHFQNGYSFLIFCVNTPKCVSWYPFRFYFLLFIKTILKLFCYFFSFFFFFALQILNLSLKKYFFHIRFILLLSACHSIPPSLSLSLFIKSALLSSLYLNRYFFVPFEIALRESIKRVNSCYYC